MNMLCDYGGVKIIQSNFWPKVQRGTDTVRFKAHPIICWLARFFPIIPYVEAEYPRMVDSDPIYITASDTVVCSVAQAHKLRSLMK